MQAHEFDEAGFFGAIEQSGARVLLIGRRALVALGMPVLTADYDLWVHIDDIELLNGALQPLELHPNHAPADARARGRYVLENDEHVDVLVAHAQSTKDGVRLAFEDAWARKRRCDTPRFAVWLPSIADLILTKRWSMRVHDVQDIQFLEALRKEEG